MGVSNETLLVFGYSAEDQTVKFQLLSFLLLAATLRKL